MVKCALQISFQGQPIKQQRHCQCLRMYVIWYICWVLFCCCSCPNERTECLSICAKRHSQFGIIVQRIYMLCRLIKFGKRLGLFAFFCHSRSPSLVLLLCSDFPFSFISLLLFFRRLLFFFVCLFICFGEKHSWLTCVYISSYYIWLWVKFNIFSYGKIFGWNQ